MLCNEVYGEVPLTCSPNWSLPSYGHLDFATRQSDDLLAGNEAMPEATEVTWCHRSNSMTGGPKLRVLRAISVHMFLSANQFRNLIQCFSEAGNDRQAFSSMLHTRVVDSDRLLSPEVLYSAILHDQYGEPKGFRLYGRPGCLGASGEASGIQPKYTSQPASLLSRICHFQFLNMLNPVGVTYMCSSNV